MCLTGQCRAPLPDIVLGVMHVRCMLLALPLQAAAGMGIYGPRTIYCIALKDAPGCHEFLLQDDGKWMHVKETTEIGGSSCPPGL